MDDSIPELIDVAAEVNKSEARVEPLLEKKQDEFKLIVSKRKRREQNKAAAAVAASTSMGDELDMEEDEEDEDDDEEIDEDEEMDNLQAAKTPANTINMPTKKFKFPPLSGEKLMVIETKLLIQT